MTQQLAVFLGIDVGPLNQQQLQQAVETAALAELRRLQRQVTDLESQQQAQQADFIALVSAPQQALVRQVQWLSAENERLKRERSQP